MIEKLIPAVNILTKEKALEQMHLTLTNKLEKPETRVLETNLSPEKKALYEMHNKIENFDPKKEIELQSEFSENINKYIKSVEELNVYKNANLREAEINNRKVLIRDDIDLNIKDDFGRSNLERMRNGRAPLDEKGNYYELHHIGQSNDSPLAELTQDEHRTKNYSILHTKPESDIDRVEFSKKIKDQHWKTRAEMLSGGKNA
ncbi:MAG: HNH/ENDO VII family nuclease [Candidatus Woesearchaeota archaeon]